mgnify:CR=1 FL=1
MIIIEEIKNIKSTKKELKKFGYSVGGVLLIIGITSHFLGGGSSIYFTSIGILLAVLGLSLPEVLLPLQKIWMVLAVVLGFVMTRVILSILFYIVIAPIGFVGRIFGKDFLDEKIDKTKSSYWNYRKKNEYDKTSTEQQF